MPEKMEWWQKTTVYQIYPRSFKDTTGNGVGDLRGVIEKLDYLTELGIETIWFSPFYPSPQEDHGYDITNFVDVEPEYGTLADFDELLADAHKRGLKIVLDMILNHTSDKHPWFLESRASRDNPKRDWYIWRDGRGKNGKKPPNKWKGMTGGRAWVYDELTEQWYFHHFLPFQPDLNMRNPEVKKAMFDVCRFWLDRGVDGFRLDIFHSTFVDAEFRDNPWVWTLLPSETHMRSFFQDHIYDLHLQETFEYAIELRKLIDEYSPPRFLVGEVQGTLEHLRRYYGPNNNGLNTVFLFPFSTLPMNPKKIHKIVSKFEDLLPPPSVPTWVYSNHDRIRMISRFSDDPAKAKVMAMLQLTLRGVPYIYYGEEIGIPQVKFSLRKSQDPIGRKYWWVPITQIKRFGFSLTRDGCRTPMQWSAAPNAGFSPNPEAVTWLKISKTYTKINVEVQEKDPNSLLNFYRRLLKVRRSQIALQEGELQLESPMKNSLLYYRSHPSQKLAILLNFSKKQLILPAPLPTPTLIFSIHLHSQALDQFEPTKNVTLQPFEGIILQ
ncbi:MAG: alpha-glucosidase [Candidatus Helarchaeota archaeon]|nr:alpha-glucosidase [Candidatus Helarchaeota archaeon]